MKFKETLKHIELAEKWLSEYPEYFTGLTLNDIVLRIERKSAFKRIIYLGDYLTTKVRLNRFKVI